MPDIPPFRSDDLRQLSFALGDTERGLTGSEIGSILHRLGIDDPDPRGTKHVRIFNALWTRQNETGAGAVVVDFVRLACPYLESCWTDGGSKLFSLRESINKGLEASGYVLDLQLGLRKRRIQLAVPTINDELRDFDALFRLWSEVKDDGLEVTFDFTGCGFLRQNAVAFLGGLARLIEHRGGTFRFDWSTFRQDVALNLAKNGFRDAFGDPTPVGIGQSIPYRQEKQTDKNATMEYLKSSWLGRGWVNVSPALRDAIVGRVWEIYANAFEHSGSAIGVFSCGQHYPKRKELKLAVVDFGVGIPSNVRLFGGNERLAADVALRWAFQPGNTTAPRDIGRGIGLELLREFVVLNRGRLEVFSHDGYARIDENGEKYYTRASTFIGTLVNISLRCDDRLYCFQSEVPDTPLF